MQPLTTAWWQRDKPKPRAVPELPFRALARPPRGAPDARARDRGAGASWWCYDLPPTWRDLTDAPLPEVCGEQWRSHHQAVLEFLEEADPDVHRVRFEDVVGGGRTDLLAELDEWLGTGGSLSRVAVEELPPVMATSPPGPRRWQRRADALGAVLASAPLAEMAALLGYDDPATWT